MPLRSIFELIDAPQVLPFDAVLEKAIQQETCQAKRIMKEGLESRIHAGFELIRDNYRGSSLRGRCSRNENFCLVLLNNACNMRELSVVSNF